MKKFNHFKKNKIQIRNMGCNSSKAGGQKGAVPKQVNDNKILKEAGLAPLD